MTNKELRHDERLITVSYNTMGELLDRTEYIRERLLNNMYGSDQHISSEYISQDENKFYLNFIITPNYIN